MKSEWLRFSDHFSLGKSQAELDFVDVPLETDIPLFVDPYAISQEADTWFTQCHNAIVGYFQLVVDSIRNGDARLAKQLLSRLHEPNDTHLGFSSNKPSGRGIGSRQADDLYSRLQESRAVQTGLLSDLADCELVIPGIGHDKISDISINVIRGSLVEYTERQCRNHNIPTRQVASGMYWDAEQRQWRNRYAPLPIYKGKRIVLVPKVAVRYCLSVDHREYYQHFVLDYLQAEHLAAGSSLVTVLRNGTRRVTKKDLKQEHPLSKKFLYEFTKDHPEVLDRYKRTLPTKPEYLRDDQIEHKQPEARNIDVAALVSELESIPSGSDAAGRYHNFIMGALQAIFHPQLRNPQKEEPLYEGRKRVDIVFDNGAREGFFSNLIERHKVTAPYIFFECKNYSEDPRNPELDQLTGRFSDKRGVFGVLVCRVVENTDLMLKRCLDVAHANRGYVIVFDDSDIKELLALRSKNDVQGVDDHMGALFRKLVMS